MKKSVLFKMMMVVLAAMMSVTFTACGNDDDETTPGSGGGSGESGTATYVEPCLDFGSSQSHVKEYMKNSAFSLDVEDNVALIYSKDNPMVTIQYIFMGGLLSVGVSYMSYEKDNYEAFQTEIEKRYKVKLTEGEPDTDLKFKNAKGVAVINGKKVEIMIEDCQQFITITYESV